MTPSFIGRTAVMWPGVRPSMRLASAPTATTTLPPRRGSFCTDTTEGSFSTIPLDLT